MGNWERVFVFLFVFFASIKLFAHDSIPLNNKTLREEAMGGRISVLEDLTGTLEFDNLVHYKFPSTSIVTANNRNINTVFWLKFDLEVEEPLTSKYIFEILDFKIDSFELYLPLEDGSYKVYKGGDKYPFGLRNYSHKNFLFNLPAYKKGSYSGFMRIKASEFVGLNFAISNLTTFYHYSITEYLLLSLFYGVVAAMAIFSLFLYVYLNEKAYLFYSLYIISLAFYFLTRDGLGFQYLWAAFPFINSFSKPLSVFMVVIFHVFFVKYYLTIERYSKILNWTVYILILSFPLLAYVLDSVVGVLPDPIIAVIIPFIFLFIFSIRLAVQGNVEARFFVVAYSIQFLSFLIFTLAYIDVLQTSALVFYSINIACAIEIIVFSLALAGKVKGFIIERDKLKDKANKVLEEKVKERTLELEERNKQLDVFVYKASHDIRGPLNSIIGLTNLALQEEESSKATEYFQYINTTSIRLSKMVEDLLSIGRVKDIEIKKGDVNLTTVITTILSSLIHYPGFERLKIKVAFPEVCMLYTDETLVYSVLQNIIENAIKYMDTTKEESFLLINFSEEEGIVRLDFEDNGLGISNESKAHIFEMFYKVNNNSSGTGLGLYLTRLSIEKLGGSIDFISEDKKGTTFVLYFNKKR